MDPAVRVEVADQSTQAPVLRDPDASRTSGLGLRIVDSLASEWGVRMVENGKTVWFIVTRL